MPTGLPNLAGAPSLSFRWEKHSTTQAPLRGLKPLPLAHALEILTPSGCLCPRSPSPRLKLCGKAASLDR